MIAKAKEINDFEGTHRGPEIHHWPTTWRLRSCLGLRCLRGCLRCLRCL
jgi:hypothetical protein